MLYGNDRENYRQFFFDVWQKQQNQEPLEPLEKMLVEIIFEHPEYQKYVSNPEKYQHCEFFPELGETNPFLHLSLHLGLKEQISIDRPQGITKLYQEAIHVFGDVHVANHCLMHCLAMELHVLARKRKAFNVKSYLKRIKKCVKRGYWSD